MEKIVAIRDPAELAGFSAMDVALVSLEELTNHKPDVHLLAASKESVSARCSLWWSGTPEYPGQRIGFIGHYAACDDRSGGKILDHACRVLADQGCTLAVGPLDGTTWRRYRFIVDRGDEPPFFLEPDNPDEWPGHFRGAGFREFAFYSSSLNTDLAYKDPRIPPVVERMERNGVFIRQLDLAARDQELDAVFELSVESFRQNFLYSPISGDEFKFMYRKILQLVRPGLTLVAEHEGRMVGFLFAYPDLLQEKRGVPVDTVVIKSVAVLPSRIYGGLGNLLIARAASNACELGYRRAIYALMHDSNNSRNMTARYSRPMRRYALFSREIP